MHLRLERPIRVFACDIDGCLAAVDHAALDLPRLHEIAELNRASAHDASVPALTLVTGRPHAYVDAFMQVLDVRLPASFENGAGLATRHPYRAWLAPAVAEGRAAVADAERLLAERDDVFVQPGKLASLSVFAYDAQRPVRALTDDLERWVAHHRLPLDVDPSTGCVNLLLRGIDKATGFDALCEAAAIDPQEVAGIGDAAGDLPWLARCDASFAPADATPEVRTRVDHAADLPDVAATLSAYRALVAANRALMR